MKRVAGIVASWLVVLLVSYAVLEMTVWRWLPRVFPLASVMNYLDQDVQLLAQYSKKNPLPDNYIAILGDSYAFGQGDWLFNRQGDVMPAYNVPHLLHDATGRDVVTFGRPASSSIKAYLEDPLAQLAFLRLRYAVADPAYAVLYFYEGNDVVDNWQEYQVRYLGHGHAAGNVQDAAYFARFVDGDILAANRAMQRAQHPVWQDRLPAGRFFMSLLAGESLKQVAAVQQWLDPKPHRPIFKPQPRDHNTVLVAGAPQKIPDRLQVPPVALRDDEIAVAMTLFSHSLHELQRRWPHTTFALVYVPAVATAYEVVSDTVNIYDTERGKNYPTSSLLPMSDRVCAAVSRIAGEAGVAFVDARPALRRAATTGFVHGPVDWLHFNEAGYRVLAGEIAGLLVQMESKQPPGGCVSLSAGK